MKFYIFAQREIENQPISDKKLVISITDTRGEMAVINCKPENLLRLVFHDIDRKGNDKYILFNNTHACELLAFINERILNGYNAIITHCGAGLSRSPAVAAALSYLLTGEDRRIITEYRLFNRRVYSTIIREFQENYNKYLHITGFFYAQLSKLKT
jgi:predicted protein tyrosine phosphatase